MSVAFVPQCMYLSISIVSYFYLCLCVYIVLSFSILVCVYVLSLLMYYLYPDVSVWDKGNKDFVIRDSYTTSIISNPHIHPCIKFIGVNNAPQHSTWQTAQHENETQTVELGKTGPDWNPSIKLLGTQRSSSLKWPIITKGCRTNLPTVMPSFMLQIVALKLVKWVLLN